MDQNEKQIALIVSMTPQGVIGQGEGLPWPRIEGDLPNFRKLTLGHTMIFGRRTYHGLPARMRPPDGRNTIVLSDVAGERINGVTVCNSMADALKTAMGFNNHIFFAGGAMVYAAALECPQLTHLYITRVKQEYPGDVFFPRYDGWNLWNLVSRDDRGEFWFETYTRRS